MMLKQGSDLNEFIAGRVIGYTLKSLPRSLQKGIVVSRDMGDGKGDVVTLVPDYSGDLHSALNLMDWVTNDGTWTWEFGKMTAASAKEKIVVHCWAKATRIRNAHEQVLFQANERTIPLAICQLALAISGKEYDPGPNHAA